MEYAIQDVAQIIGARTKALHDCTISILLTDSRRLSFPETSLFFALATKTNDGHRYVQDLYKLRVRNFVVSKMLPEFEQMEEANFMLVKDVLAALQKLVAYHRKRFQIPVIGITGSNGKTVVKEFLYQLLHNEFDIVRSPRSYNSQIGVPLSVWEMNEKNTLGIFEAGISQAATDYCTNHRCTDQHRRGSPRELYFCQPEMSRKTDAFQRERSNYLRWR